MPALFSVAPAVTSNSGLEHFYFPLDLARLDDEKREITAWCFTQPRVKNDRWNLKYDTLQRSAPAYLEMPCIREMHQASAAGKALSVRFDDATQRAEMVLRVVDDQAWKKVKEGVYRGLSIGGVPTLTRGNDVEAFDWYETSLVDRPKDSGAVFTAIRVEGGDAEYQVVELPENASDADVELARLQIASGEFSIERYNDDQPRDDGGKWTIIGGKRVSIEGKDIGHADIDAAKTRFGLSDEATEALHKGHDEGKVTNDDHLYRTIAHAQVLSGGLHAATSEHVKSAIEHHGAGGHYETKWAAWTHTMTPKLQQGTKFGAPLGVGELQPGDTVHSFGDEKSGTIFGKVAKINPKTIDIEHQWEGVTHGVRVKKEALMRPGHVRRDGQDGPTIHHVEVNRAEGSGDLQRTEFNEELMRYHAEAITAVLSRVDPDDREEAVNQVVERMLAIYRGEADSAIEDMETLERAGGRGWQTQPRDDIGRWTDGAGKLNVAHVQHVMRHEGITEQHHHDEVKRKIESGELKTREDVLKHIDAIHEARKKDADGKGDKGNKKPDATKPKEGDEGGKTGEEHKPNEKRPGIRDHLKKLAKDAMHAFVKGYRKGSGLVKRAENGEEQENEEIPQLIEDFYEALGEASDENVVVALKAALAKLSPGASTVGRAITTDTPNLPTRENLEGGSPQGATDIQQQIQALVEQLKESASDPATLAKAQDAIEAAQELLRGEGDESPATNPLARVFSLRGDLSRMERSLSTAQAEAQASIRRAEVAEEELGTAKTTINRLEGENTKLRNMPTEQKPPVTYTGVVERVFASNSITAENADPRTVQRGQLTEERQTLWNQLQGEADATKRSDGALKLMQLDAQIQRLG